MLVNARSCSPRAFGRAVPIALSIVVLASGCSPRAPRRGIQRAFISWKG